MFLIISEGAQAMELISPVLLIPNSSPLFASVFSSVKWGIRTLLPISIVEFSKVSMRHHSGPGSLKELDKC